MSNEGTNVDLDSGLVGGQRKLDARVGTVHFQLGVGRGYPSLVHEAGVVKPGRLGRSSKVVRCPGDVGEVAGGNQNAIGSNDLIGVG